MTDLAYHMISIFVAEVILLTCLISFDKKREYDKIVRATFTINANYVDYLWMPVGIQALGIIIFSRWIEDFAYPATRAIPAFLLTMFVVAFVLCKRYRRFYFNDNGVDILYLVTNKLDQIPFQDIKRCGIKKTIKSTMYFVEVPSGQINFSRHQLGDEKKFLEYFRKHNIELYLYSSTTGMYRKLD